MRIQTILIALVTAGAVFAQAPASHPASTAVHHAPAARPSLTNPASLKAKAPETFQARFVTSAGDFTVTVHRAWAPLGADRFYNLVRAGFFNGGAFFRVVPGFVVQFGLSPTPAISKVWQTANIQDDPVTQSNKRGFLTFATAGPNTRTTQLFISLADNQRLDGMGFAPFAEVTQGMETVDKITSKYGEQPQQDRVTNEGKAYLLKQFPDIDVVKTATVVAPAPAAHAAPKTAVHHTAPRPAAAPHPAAAPPAN